MKIAYLLHVLGGQSSGVLLKIVGQVEEWKKLGESVKIFLVTSEQETLDTIETLIYGLDVEIVSTLYKNEPYPLRLRHFGKIAKLVIGWTPNLVYTRQDTYYPAVEQIASNFPLIIEVNSNDIAEYAHTGVFRRLFFSLTRSRILRKSAGLVFISSEIARMEQYSKFKILSEVIPNGINFSRVVQLEARYDPSETRLVFVGSPSQTWHGVDRLFEIAKMFPLWIFDVVGPIQPVSEVPLNVIFHGLLTPAKTSDLFSRSVCGIGSLALFRNKMSEGSPLKTREYLAHGLPVIAAYNDPDIPNGADYFLKLENSDAPLGDQKNEIESFVSKWKGRRVPRSEVSQIGTDIKEVVRLRFFEYVVANFQTKNSLSPF